MTSNQAQTCPCHSGKTFDDCCGKFILAKEQPATPEQLMRSRYSAYTLKNENYLLNTWHSSARPSFLELENDKTQWKKLVVLYSSESEVHFVAFFTSGKNDSENVFSLYEESEFIKENGSWFYLSGKELKTTELSKNMLCPCKSGKKFKRCCMPSL